MPQSRQLAAIMFTDIEGYTAIMQQNEQKAIMLKDRHRLIIENEHKKFDGRIIQYYGDGTLSIFPSAVNAVLCALTMQQLFCEMPQVPVRMGLHTGDIVINDEDVFGDGVNLASRIESLGVTGSVLISDKVNDELQNHPEIKTISMGTYQFKNIQREVEVFALDHEGLVKPIPDSLKGKTEEKKAPSISSCMPEHSVAVLPFVNMSNDPEQEYFSDGISEEILNSLSHLKNLKVAGRTSSFQFKGKNLDLRVLGQKLGVNNVLEGSVRRYKNRLRVTAQLVNVEDGFHLWSEKYDRDMDDIFAIQDEIALAITENLKVILLEKEKKIITKTHTQNTEAYEFYLRGRFYLNKRFLFQSLEQFIKAAEIDPEFAKAYAGLADAYVILGFYNFLPAKEVMPKAKQAAEAAIRLDNSLCEPYCSLGMYYAIYEWHWKEAKYYFLKSIQLNPRYVQSHVWFGHYYLSWIEGKLEEGIKHLNIAIELEPHNAMSYVNKYAVVFTMGNFEEAFKIAKQGYEMDPDSLIGNRIMGLAYLFKKQYAKATEFLEFASKLSNYAAFNQVDLIRLYTSTGSLDKARTLMEDFKRRLKEGKYVSSCIMSFAAGFLDDIDEGFNWLERAYEEHDAYLCILHYYPWVPDKLRQDSRFQSFISKMNFPNKN